MLIANWNEGKYNVPNFLYSWSDNLRIVPMVWFTLSQIALPLGLCQPVVICSMFKNWQMTPTAEQVNCYQHLSFVNTIKVKAIMLPWEDLCWWCVWIKDHLQMPASNCAPSACFARRMRWSVLHLYPSRASTPYYSGLSMWVTFWWFWWWMSSCVCIVSVSQNLLGTTILGVSRLQSKHKGW